LLLKNNLFEFADSEKAAPFSFRTNQRLIEKQGHPPKQNRVNNSRVTYL
jgi:hypothetical protein